MFSWFNSLFIKEKVLRIEPFDDTDWLITTNKTQYVGWSSVFYEYSTGRECGLFKNTWVAKELRKHQWKLHNDKTQQRRSADAG